MATVLEHITGALRLIGVVAEGEQPSMETVSDARLAFNQLLDSWAAQGLILYAIQDQSMAWPSGSASRTFGPSGDVAGLRPVAIRSAYYSDSDDDDILTIISDGEYKAIPDKTLSAPPMFLWANFTAPDVTLCLYPVPNENITLHLTSTVEFTQVSDLSASLVVPPGYLRAFRFGLAVELAAEFGVEPPATVQRNAWQAMRWIKRVNSKNNRTNILSLPAELVGKSRSNIYLG